MQSAQVARPVSYISTCEVLRARVEEDDEAEIGDLIVSIGASIDNYISEVAMWVDGRSMSGDE